jgi:predicted lysophospholipase L1 biosynthesis ABC-type transport system permease subunit
VAGLEPLSVGLAQTSPNAVWPNEAWYNVDPAVDRYDLGLAQQRFPNANILDRRELEAAAASDPVRLGLESNLLIGAITALALGIMAFALYFLVVAPGRLKEYAVLEGGGMPRALIWRSLFIEQVIVVGFSLGTGLVLGLLLAFALLPSLQLGTELFDLVPATVVTVDAGLVIAVLGSLALAALLISRFGTRVGGHYRLMDELRSLG